MRKGRLLVPFSASFSVCANFSFPVTERTFHAPSRHRQHWFYAVMHQPGYADLVFDGLDGAAEVSVNGVQVLVTGNSFRIWRMPAKAHLHAGKNTLYVVFPSPLKAAAEAAATDPWQ